MSYKARIVAAFAELDDECSGSSSVAIKEHVQASLPEGEEWSDATFLETFRSMEADGEIVQSKAVYMLNKIDEWTKIGTFQYADGDIYEGDVKNGEAHGKGVCRYANGDVYDGEWEDDGPHGRGVLRFANGDVYEGEFKDGMRHGRGKQTCTSGVVCDGEWKNDREHGVGTKTDVNGNAYEGEFVDGKRHGRGKFTLVSGEVYEGDFKDGKEHGWGTLKFSSGNVYVGEFTEGLINGKGAKTWANGDVYEGEWKDEKEHGTGTMAWANGDVYEGQWMGGKYHGEGTLRLSSGNVYAGEFANHKAHGKGTLEHENGNVYKGEFLRGNRHGWGILTWKESGNTYEGPWVEGKRHGKGVLKVSTGGTYVQSWVNGEQTIGERKTQSVLSSPSCNAGGASSNLNTGAQTNDGSPTSSREPSASSNGDLPGKVYSEPQLRSQRSQQRRLQTDKDKKACEYCGVDDYQYKLRVCSGCNLALYCSASCQKAASGPHRRICNIISELPSRNSGRLVLRFDKDKLVDLDAGLRYGTKYMDSLRHLEIDLKTMTKDDAAKLSPERLASLLRSKKALETVFWENRHRRVFSHNDNEVWTRLHALKQLRLEYLYFDDVQLVHDIIHKQKNTLMALCLPLLGIDWTKAKSRKTIAQAISTCKHLVKLNLVGCLLMDADLKIMLQDLPDLRVLNLTGCTNARHEFTDNTCSLIARKCSGLQELVLANHDRLSVRGIRRIFEGCSHLRAFFTTARKLSCGDIQELLDIAPQLVILGGLARLNVSDEEITAIVEGTGGRTVVLFFGDDCIMDPRGLSASSRERYAQQKDVYRCIKRKHDDPEIANEWEDMLES